MKSLEERLLKDVDAILGPNGLIAQSSGHDLHYNAQQHQYARRAAMGLARFDAKTGKTAINMLQAATGTGKTLGYLVPLMLFAAYGKNEVARVAVSTFTRHLQKQIVNKDAITASNWVIGLTGVRLKIALRMGIGNFVSATAAARLSDTLSRIDDSRYDEAIDFLDALIRWLGKKESSGLLHDFLVDHELGYIPFGITLKDIALEHSDSEDEKACYLAMVNASKDADVLIINHSLVVTNAICWSGLLDDPDKRPISALVLDEADRLVDAAESVTGAGVSLHRMMSVCESLGNEKSVVAAKALLDFVKAMKVPLSAAVAIDKRSELSAHLKATLTILRPIGKECETALLANQSAATDSSRTAHAAFLDMLQMLESTASAIDDPIASACVSWSPVREYPSLRVGHPNPGRVLSRLWNLRKMEEGMPPGRGYLDAVLLTSATLETPGRDLPRAFDEFAMSVGIVRFVGKDNAPVHNVSADLFARFEPPKFGRMEFVLASPGAPLPSRRDEDSESFDTNPEWLDYVAMMARAAHSTGKRTLALTLSWRDTAEIGRRLAGLKNLVVHRHGQTLHEVLNEFVTTEGALLITPSGWEGVDLRGIIKNLLITRIPFSPNDDASNAHRRIHFEHLGYSREKIDAIIFNEKESATRRKLSQGIGRGIRSHDDSVVLWLGDPRFPLPENFADSLDPILLEMPTRRSRGVMRHCIPQRFRETSYPKAKLFLENGTLHTVTDLS